MAAGRLRRAGRAAAAAATSPSASTTTSTHSSLAVRPRLQHRARRRRPRASSTASAPTAPSAPTRTRSRSSARRRRLYAQGYFVYDSKKSGSIDRLAPALRPAADPLLVPDRARATSSPATSSTSSSGSDVLDVADDGRDVPAQQRRTAPTRSGTSCRARCRSRSSTKKLQLLRDRRATRVAREAGLGGRINTVMQTCFFALSGVLPARRGDRRDQGGDREDLRRSAARRSSTATSRPSTCALDSCTRSTCPAAVTASDASRPRRRRGARLRAAGHARR